MDLLHMDPGVLLPGLLVTLLAVVAAWTLLGRRSDSSASSPSADKKRSVGYGDEAPPSRALATPTPAHHQVGSI